MTTPYPMLAFRQTKTPPLHKQVIKEMQLENITENTWVVTQIRCALFSPSPLNRLIRENGRWQI